MAFPLVALEKGESWSGLETKGSHFLTVLMSDYMADARTSTELNTVRLIPFAASHAFVGT